MKCPNCGEEFQFLQCISGIECVTVVDIKDDYVITYHDPEFFPDSVPSNMFYECTACGKIFRTIKELKGEENE